MSEYHRACRDCVLNRDCLLQSQGDVEDCEDVQEYEKEERKRK